MADKEDIVLEKPEDTLNEPRLDESLGEFKGQEGQAPEDEEFASLPEELPRENSDSGFKFTRESAPEEVYLLYLPFTLFKNIFSIHQEFEFYLLYLDNFP